MALAIDGHHPAINLHLVLSPQQKIIVTQSIMKQRTCQNFKTNSQFFSNSHTNHGITSQGNPKVRRIMKKSQLESVRSSKILNTQFNLARVSVKAVPKWRNGINWPPTQISLNPNDEHSNLWHGTVQKTRSENRLQAEPTYHSRKLTCCRLGCKGGTETAHMQLHTPQGYRNLQCTACHRQGRCKNWLCIHGISWHTCDEHRQDPAAHLSTRGRNVKVADEHASKIRLLPSNRDGPVLKSRRAQPTSVKRGVKRDLSPDVGLDKASGLYSLDPSQCPRLAAKFRLSDRFVQPRIASADSATCTGVVGLREPRDETK